MPDRHGVACCDVDEEASSVVVVAEVGFGFRCHAHVERSPYRGGVLDVVQDAAVAQGLTHPSVQLSSSVDVLQQVLMDGCMAEDVECC